jgi:hypothetical protein
MRQPPPSNGQVDARGWGAGPLAPLPQVLVLVVVVTCIWVTRPPLRRTRGGQGGGIEDPVFFSDAHGARLRMRCGTTIAPLAVARVARARPSSRTHGVGRSVGRGIVAVALEGKVACRRERAALTVLTWTWGAARASWPRSRRGPLASGAGWLASRSGLGHACMSARR